MKLANKISIFKILLVPFLIGCLLYYSPRRDNLRYVALIIFVICAISDAVDGYIARKYKQQTEAGLVLDPLGDKFLIDSSFICLALIGLKIKFPIWAALIVLSRDIIIIGGAIVIFIIKQHINLVATRWGKTTTTFQMLSIISVLLQWQFSYLLWTVAVFFTLISGINYVMRGFKILYAVDNNRNNK